jgi:hypothetical protein
MVRKTTVRWITISLEMDITLLLLVGKDLRNGIIPSAWGKIRLSG